MTVELSEECIASAIKLMQDDFKRKAAMACMNIADYRTAKRNLNEFSKAYAKAKSEKGTERWEED